jgi:hypothetical protein
MPDFIEFLERLGRDASLRHAPAAVLEQAVRDAQLDPRLREALMRGDQAEVEAILGVNNVCCMVYVPIPPGADETEPAGTPRQAAA